MITLLRSLARFWNPSILSSVSYEKGDLPILRLGRESQPCVSSFDSGRLERLSGSLRRIYTFSPSKLLLLPRGSLHSGATRRVVLGHVVYLMYDPP